MSAIEDELDDELDDLLDSDGGRMGPHLGAACADERPIQRQAGIVEDLTLWRVARKPRQGADYRLVCQGPEGEARAYFTALDVRQGSACLLAPGQPLAKCWTSYTAVQSGPNLRSRW